MKRIRLPKAIERRLQAKVCKRTMCRGGGEVIREMFCREQAVLENVVFASPVPIRLVRVGHFNACQLAARLDDVHSRFPCSSCDICPPD